MAKNSNAINYFSPAKLVVSKVAGEGTHTTFANAVAVASSGDTIMVMPGIYTENFTLPSGVNLQGFNTTDFNTVQFGVGAIIHGTLTGASGSSVGSNISGIGFTTNSINSIAGSNIILTFNDCCFYSTSAIPINTSNESNIKFFNCNFVDENTGQIFSCSDTQTTLQNCNLYNPSSESGINTFSGSSTLLVYNSVFQYPISLSNTSYIQAFNSSLIAASLNVSSVALTGTGISIIYNCSLTSGTASAINIGAGTTLNLFNCVVNSSNTNALTGSGTLNYGQVTFSGTSATINVTTQNPVAIPTFQGGTGLTSPGTTGNVLTSNGTTWTSSPGGGGFTPVNFSVKISGNIANVTGDGTQYPILYDTVLFDSATAYSTGTGLYTFPTTGIYQINLTHFVYGGGVSNTTFLGFLYVNGATNIRLMDANPGNLGLTVNGEFMASATYLYKATAGDTMGGYVQVGGGSKNVGVAGGTESCLFSGFRVA